MSFARCYLLFFPFCFASKHFESIPICNKHFSEFCLLWKCCIKNWKSQLMFLNFCFKQFWTKSSRSALKFIESSQQLVFSFALENCPLRKSWMKNRKAQLRFFDKHFLTIIFSNFLLLKAIFRSVISTAIFSFKIANNGLTLPEVAVWQPSFLHYRKRK